MSQVCVASLLPILTRISTDSGKSWQLLVSERSEYPFLVQMTDLAADDIQHFYFENIFDLKQALVRWAACAAGRAAARLLHGDDVHAMLIEEAILEDEHYALHLWFDQGTNQFHPV